MQFNIVSTARWGLQNRLAPCVTDWNKIIFPFFKFKGWEATVFLQNKCLFQKLVFVQQDTELQAWILDIHDNGYTVREGEADHGFPSSVESAEQLAHILTIIIFTCSCQHAAVNFSQMDVFGFSPNAPTLLRQPPPTEKGKLTMKDMMKSLPTKHQVGVAIATVYDLTRIFPDEVSNDLSVINQKCLICSPFFTMYIHFVIQKWISFFQVVIMYAYHCYSDHGQNPSLLVFKGLRIKAEILRLLVFLTDQSSDNNQERGLSLKKYMDTALNSIIIENFVFCSCCLFNK